MTTTSPLAFELELLESEPRVAFVDVRVSVGGYRLVGNDAAELYIERGWSHELSSSSVSTRWLPSFRAEDDANVVVDLDAPGRDDAKDRLACRDTVMEDVDRLVGFDIDGRVPAPDIPRPEPG